MITTLKKVVVVLLHKIKEIEMPKTSEDWVKLVDAISSGCVRLVLAVGLCIAGCDLAKGMKVTSLLELSKGSEECKTMFQKLTNDIAHASQELASSTQNIARVTDGLSSATNALRLSKKAADDIKEDLEVACAQMKNAEGMMMCCTNKVNRCLCPCCWCWRW